MALDFLQSRFQRRCPTLLFTLSESDGATVRTKQEASRMLSSKGYDSFYVEHILSQFDSDDLGNIHEEDFLKLCALARSAADTAAIATAVGMVDPRRRVALQLRGSIVQPWGAAPPQQWHEHACSHLGLRGCVRHFQSGLLLGLAAFLQGQEADIRAYVDALLAEEVCSSGEGLKVSVLTPAPSQCST
jgi:hypothetical protein